jgi:hypothetical protein
MDPVFNQILADCLGASPFRSLPGDIGAGHTVSRDALIEAFKKVFNGDQARQVSNVVFYWQLDKPFMHMEGHQLPSTISYIEISKRTLSARWTSFRFLRDGEDDAQGSLRQLANNNDNFAFYSRLIRQHGPLKVWYATLTELNAAAAHHGQPERDTVRQWESHLLRSYKAAHGTLPLKNRRC